MSFTIKFPTNYNEITLEQYRKISALQETEKTDIHKVMGTIRILTGMTENQLLSIGSKDIERIQKVLAWLNTPPQDLELQTTFTLDGVEYGVIPDIDNISVGEFADLETMCQDANENLHEIMAIMYRPITRRVGSWYEVEAYKPTAQKAEAMLQAPFGVAVSLMVFFSSIENELVRNTLQFLAEERQAEYLRNGDGTKSSTH